jgi:hypothetical protein
MGGGLSRLPFVSRPEPYPEDAELAKKGRFHERNQYFLRTADRAAYAPAALLDAEAETAASRVSITEDVPLLRIDNLTTKSSLLRVRRSQFPKAGGVTLELNRCGPPHCFGCFPGGGT